MPSPWISELSLEHKHKYIDSNLETDIVIIGAGISGVVTAYFTLKNTNHEVTILEGYKVAHGASGHNAGQVVGYFERPFTDIIREFGLDMATEAQRAVYSGWDLITNIIQDTQIDIDFQQFWGWAGCQTIEELVPKLENDYLRNLNGFDINNCLIDQDWDQLHNIPHHLVGTYQLVDKLVIKEHLNTNSTNFIACLGSKKGTINSALLCEKLIGYLLTHYVDRFQIYEHSQVKQILTNTDNCQIIVEPNQQFIKAEDIPNLTNHLFYINCHKVVLCTNGFKDFQILNLASLESELNQQFQQNLSGLVGFMAGYLDSTSRDNTAITYFLPELEYQEDPAYFYLTRRQFGRTPKTLTCIGGPDLLLEPHQTYDHQRQYINDGIDRVDKFLHHYYTPAPMSKINYDFEWHGLMGYTSSGIRLIGPSIENPNLLYNLGCNGIGILPSIYGGFKISQFLLNITQATSIFDPK